ncbi:MAG TPA: inverse autotransporter beta domain-containing protein, partial [Verrucomicrobium sp.]|nr:inverse autotransporter beta domain-containing protein [Verrucomicrobium sp.]
MKTPTSRFYRSILNLFTACLTTALVHGGPVDKNPDPKNPVVIPEPHPMYLGSVNSGIKGNDSYIDGNFSIVAPVWSSLGADATLSGGLLFLEPYVSYGEGGEIAASLGLGYRHLFGSQPVSAITNHDGHQAGFMEEGVFIGGSVFVDMLDTEADNQFWQLGVGLEAGTRYVEVRGNYYIPLSDRQLAEEFRTREQRQSSSTATSNSVTPLSDPYATGNTIAQDALFTSRATTTTRTTTIERLFRRYEEGMEGWDAEVSILLPWVDKFMDVRVIGGYYSFDNQPFGPQEGGTGNVEGWKAGLEIRPVPAVVLTGTWYEDDRLTGGDWTAGVQLQIPFEAGDLGDGKGFWGRIGDSFKPRRRHLAERLAQPVYRQNAAVKIASSVEQEKVTTSTKVQRVTRVVSQREGQIVLKDDIIFVNNDGPVGNGIQAGAAQAAGADGTAERPFDTLTEGSFAAGTNSNVTSRIWNVYTQGGTGTPYVDDVDLTGSTNYISSFTPIHGLAGTTFGGDTARPVWRGGVYGSGQGFLGVTGYSIRQGYVEDIGIFAENVGSVVVLDNIFRNTAGGVFVETYEAGGDFNAVIAGNRFEDAEVGLEIHAHNGAKMTALAADNRFEGVFNEGLYAETSENSRMNLAILGNRFDGLFFDDGIGIETHNRSRMDLVIDSNTLVGAYEDGINLEKYNRSILIADITNNKIGNGSSYFDESGIELTSNDSSDNNSRLVALVSENTLNGTFNDFGILASSYGQSTLRANIRDNVLRGYYDDGGITANRHTGSYLRANIVDNRLAGEFDGHGIGLTSHGNRNGLLDATIRRNVLVGEFTDGIGVDSYGRSVISAEIAGNVLRGTFTEVGIDIDKHEQSIIQAFIFENRLIADEDPGSDNFGVGIRLSSRDDSTASSQLLALVGFNELSGDFTKGIEMNSYDNARLGGLLAFNLLSGTFDAGIDLDKADASRMAAIIQENELSGTFDRYGMRIVSSDAPTTLRARVLGNVLSGTFTDKGIAVRSEGGSLANVRIRQNDLQGTFGGVGIELISTDLASITGRVGGNQLSGTFANGIVIDARDNGDAGDALGSSISVEVENNNLAGTFSGFGIHARSRNDASLTVSEFNNNRVTGTVPTAIRIQNGGTLEITG